MPKTLRVWNRAYFPVLMTYFIDNFGLAIVYPIFSPLFLRSRYDLFGGVEVPLLHRTFLLGLLIASFPLAQMIGAPLFGRLSDRFGRRKLFLLTLSGGIVGYFLTGLGIYERMLIVLWLGRIIAGFFAGNLTLCLATVADISSEKKDRSRHFGVIGTIGGLGFIFAILSAAGLSDRLLASFFRPDLPFFLTSCLLLINLVLMLLFFKDKRTVTKSVPYSWPKQGSRAIYLVYFFFFLSWFTSMQFLSAYLIQSFASTTNLTITFTFAGIGVIWSISNFILNPLLAKNYPPYRIFLFGMIFLGVFLLLTLIPNQPKMVFLTHFFLATLFAALCWTNGLATLSLSGTTHNQGTLMGLSQAIISIALIIGPLIGGILAGIDLHKLYLFTGLSSLLGAFVLWRKTCHSLS